MIHQCILNPDSFWLLGLVQHLSPASSEECWYQNAREVSSVKADLGRHTLERQFLEEGKPLS